MVMYIGGKKVKSVYYGGRKVKEAYYGGKRVYRAYRQVTGVSNAGATKFVSVSGDTGILTNGGVDSGGGLIFSVPVTCDRKVTSPTTTYSPGDSIPTATRIIPYADGNAPHIFTEIV